MQRRNLATTAAAVATAAAFVVAVGTPATPAVAAGGGLVAVPVSKCATEFAVEGIARPRVPTDVLANVSASAAKRLFFYSNGFLGVLAPKGWTCSAVEAADGSESLQAHPAGQPDAFPSKPPANAQAVTVMRDSTSHGPGTQLVCTLFPNSPAARVAASLGCPKRHRGETVRYPVPTVALYRDPPHVKGTGALSGGRFPASGAQVYPFTDDSPAGAGVVVNDVSCVLRRSALCSTIVADFVHRAAPDEQLRTPSTSG